VIETLERLGVAHHIGGSVASSALGIARATLDVDLVADLSDDQVGPFVAALAEDYYADEAAIREAVRRRGSFNLIHLATMLKIDVFQLKDTPYDREAFARRRAGTLGEGDARREVFFASPEDTVLNKLQWYELGGRVSERQWGDVLGVLRVQAGRLDEDYLDRWARELGLEELLARAREQAADGARPRT